MDREGAVMVERYRILIMKRECNAIELSVEVGALLTVEFQESGWAWASKETGESGWVPLEHLRRG